MGDGFVMAVAGKTYQEKKEAGQAILEQSERLQAGGVMEELIGAYLGFSMLLTFNPLEKQYILIMRGNAAVKAYLGNDPGGVIIRINNALDSLEKHCEQTMRSLEDTKGQLAVAKEEVKKDFPREAEYQQKLKRLAQLNTMLNVDEREKPNAPWTQHSQVAEERREYRPGSGGRSI